MEGRHSVWSDLIVALLSVADYPVERTLQRLGGLEAAGLFDPDVLKNLEITDAARRLGRAGYDRAPVVTRIIAERLLSLGAWIADRGTADCEEVLYHGSPSDVERILLPVKGIGPFVVRNFLLLRGKEERDESKDSGAA